MTNSENYILKAENLDVHYGDLQALHDVSIAIKKGSIVSIIGSNGAGKSTLLNTIVGINKPTKGKVIYDNQDISGLPTNNIVSKGITMSPEGSRVFEKLSVKENLLMGAYLPHARKKKDELLEKVYELFPILKEKSSQLATYLSGGQRQMLAIARAIMSEPQVILCDEISLGLAPVIIKDIYQKIKEINEQGMTVVLVEQDVKRSLKHSDYSYVIVKGKIVMEGPSSELPEEEVKDAYFGVNKYA
jgi:branched-chain amino acid transport system ATP-binding protein